MNTKKCLISVSALAILLSNNVVSAKEIDSNKIDKFTGGSECHAYNSPTGVIKPVYDYCQSSLIFNKTTENVSVVTKKKNHNSTSISTPSKPVVNKTPTVVIVKTPKPKETPVPPQTNNCKNKNWNKERTPDCNAGKGNG